MNQEAKFGLELRVALYFLDIENNEKIQQIVFGTSALCWSRAGLCGNLSKFCHKPHIGS